MTPWEFHQIVSNSWHSVLHTSTYVFRYLVFISMSCFCSYVIITLLTFLFLGINYSTIGVERFVYQHFANMRTNWHSWPVNRCKHLQWAKIPRSYSRRCTSCKLHHSSQQKTPIWAKFKKKKHFSIFFFFQTFFHSLIYFFDSKNHWQKWYNIIARIFQYNFIASISIRIACENYKDKIK